MNDYISRADAMGAVQDHFNADGFKGYDDGQKMMDRIKALPSAEASQNLTKPNNYCEVDLISRADAIEAIDDAIDADSPQWAILRTKIGFLPSAEAEWIPCSERLPNVGEDVLFCDSEWTEEGWLMANGDWWQLRWSTVVPKEEVTAWMPLPKPYREDGEA